MVVGRVWDTSAGGGGVLVGMDGGLRWGFVDGERCWEEGGVGGLWGIVVETAY